MKHFTDISDWEELRESFEFTESFKVGYNEEGTIWSCGKDPKWMNVAGCVGVLEVESLPEPWNGGAGWWVNAEKGAIERDPLMNPWLKQRKIETAIRKIQETELLESMRPATFIALPGARMEPSDSALWMNYLFDLSRIDETVNEDIEWPEKPS